MLRTVWLGLGCLICIGGLFSLRISFGAPTKLAPPANDRNIVASIGFDPSLKADRLNSSFAKDTSEKIFVKPISVALLKVDPPSSGTVTATEEEHPTNKSSKTHSGHSKGSSPNLARGLTPKLHVVSRVNRSRP
jgi:hypothetical protein